mgnify:CR=1 FL=1
MIKFILPAVIVFLIVLFWEKISQVMFEKFNIKINSIGIIILVVILIIILTLLYF